MDERDYESVSPRSPNVAGRRECELRFRPEGRVYVESDRSGTLTQA